MLDFLIVVGAKYLIGLPIFVLFLYFVLVNKKKQWNFALLAALSLPLAYGVGLVLGQIYYNARPFVVEGVAPLVAHAANNGMPSDHMLFASTLAMLGVYCNRRLGIFLWIVALLVGVSRVLAGVHHAIDIFAGALIAAVVVYGVDLLLQGMRWYRR